MKLTDYFKKYKLLIFSGNGGTGKTTLSAAAAMEAVGEGYRVGLITIDPSRRLGAVFDMDISTETHKRKTFPKTQTNGKDTFLDIFLINSPEIIKEFVLKNYSKDFYNQLQKNKLFAQISSVLSENQSVSTIYKVAEMIRSGEYDIIIVDTPPANHSVDFFRSPEQVIRIFQDNMVAKAVIEAKGVKLWYSKKVFIKILSFLVGEEFVAEMENFFVAIFSFQEHIIKAAGELEKILKGKDVCYFLVTLPETRKADEVLQVVEELSAQGIRVNDVIINRAFPDWLNLNEPLKNFPQDLKDFQVYYDQVWRYYGEQNQALRELLAGFNKELNAYFVPEKPFFKDDFDIGAVQQLMRSVFK
jgi:anion-transporting  ArsA/GET3 family ATPase